MKEGEGSEEGSPRGSALIIGEELRSESRDRRQHLGSERDRKRDYDQPPSDLFAKFSLDRSKGTIIILSYSKARFSGGTYPAANRFDPAEFQSSENTRIPTFRTK